MTTSLHPQTAKFLGVVGQNMPRLSTRKMQYWIDHPAELQEVLKQGLMPEGDEESPTTPAQKQYLRQVGTIALPARAKKFDPREFFKTREGLYVWPEFIDRILTVVGEAVSLPAMDIASFDLLKDANDAEIQSELPVDYVFGADDLCSRLAGMIECQPNGKSGDLVVNGYANIFYVRGKADQVFAVDVRWDADRRGWNVDAYPLRARPWCADYRAFSRSC